MKLQRKLIIVLILVFIGVLMFIKVAENSHDIVTLETINGIYPRLEYELRNRERKKAIDSIDTCEQVSDMFYEVKPGAVVIQITLKKQAQVLWKASILPNGQTIKEDIPANTTIAYQCNQNLHSDFLNLLRSKGRSATNQLQ